jgi:hypothetical protein
MKHGLVIIFSFLFLFPLSAQNNIDSVIIFNVTVYNFGVLKEGSDSKYAFTFINKSKNPVAIANVRSFCNCVDLAWTKTPVKPNDSGKITIKFDASTTGTFSKTVHVYTDKSDKPILLTVKGTVSPLSAKTK